MSLYHVQKVMFLLKKDEQLAQALKQDPDAALQPFPLTAQERAAVADSTRNASVATVGASNTSRTPIRLPRAAPRPSSRSSFPARKP